MIKNLTIASNVLLILYALFMFLHNAPNNFISTIFMFFFVVFIPAVSIAYINNKIKLNKSWLKQLTGFNALIILAIIVYAAWPSELSAIENFKIIAICALLSVPFGLNIYLIKKINHG